MCGMWKYESRNKAMGKSFARPKTNANGDLRGHSPWKPQPVLHRSPADISNRYPRSATPVVHPRRLVWRRISFLFHQTATPPVWGYHIYVASFGNRPRDKIFDPLKKRLRRTLVKYYSRYYFQGNDRLTLLRRFVWKLRWKLFQVCALVSSLWMYDTIVSQMYTKVNWVFFFFQTNANKNLCE